MENSIAEKKAPSLFKAAESGDLREGYFSLTLRPCQSLSSAFFQRFILIYGAVFLTAAMIFLNMGAWPVFGFMGAEFLLLYLAFRYRYRWCSSTYDKLELEAGTLTLEQSEGKNPPVMIQLPAYWLNAVVEYEAGKPHLRLYSHGKYHEIGKFLGERQQKEVASLINQALRRNR
jgi:uncharacterized membrane protein